MATTKVIPGVLDLNQASSSTGLKMPKGISAYAAPPAVAEGMMRNEVGQASNGSVSSMQHFNGTDWKNYQNLPNAPVTFNIDYLLVGGGGGGGFNLGGGGGAGAYIVSYNSETGGGSVPATGSTGEMSRGVTYNITVGTPGAGATDDLSTGTNGSSTVLNFEGRGGGGAISQTAIGGGGGGTMNSNTDTTQLNGVTGASGGGGSRGNVGFGNANGGTATSVNSGFNGGAGGTGAGNTWN